MPGEKKRVPLSDVRGRIIFYCGGRWWRRIPPPFDRGYSDNVVVLTPEALEPGKDAISAHHRVLQVLSDSNGMDSSYDLSPLGLEFRVRSDRPLTDVLEMKFTPLGVGEIVCTCGTSLGTLGKHRKHRVSWEKPVIDIESFPSLDIWEDAKTIKRCSFPVSLLPGGDAANLRLAFVRMLIVMAIEDCIRNDRWWPRVDSYGNDKILVPLRCTTLNGNNGEATNDDDMTFDEDSQPPSPVSITSTLIEETIGQAFERGLREAFGEVRKSRREEAMPPPIQPFCPQAPRHMSGNFIRRMFQQYGKYEENYLHALYVVQLDSKLQVFVKDDMKPSQERLMAGVPRGSPVVESDISGDGVSSMRWLISLIKQKFELVSEGRSFYVKPKGAQVQILKRRVERQDNSTQTDPLPDVYIGCKHMREETSPFLFPIGTPFIPN
jgi:hypothetical protein